NNPLGLSLCKNELNIKRQLSLGGSRIYPLIVSDNFYFDHDRYIYDEESKRSVINVSYFELSSLLTKPELFELKSTDWRMFQLFMIKNKKNKSLPDEVAEYFNTNTSSNDELIKQVDKFINKNKYDIWEGQGPNVKRLIEILETNLFWEYLEVYLPSFSVNEKFTIIKKPQIELVI
ncbi:MAG: hypothetical protein IH946_02720, partial [Bacteroidetes bacterium]|nr:hypothetical protein [Bacteroidota bacterium]